MIIDRRWRSDNVVLVQYQLTRDERRRHPQNREPKTTAAFETMSSEPAQTENMNREDDKKQEGEKKKQQHPVADAVVHQVEAAQEERQKFGHACLEAFCCCCAPLCQFEEQEEQRQKYREKRDAQKK